MSEYFKYYDDFGFKPESYDLITPDRYPSDIIRRMSGIDNTDAFVDKCNPRNERVKSRSPTIVDAYCFSL